MAAGFPGKDHTNSGSLDFTTGQTATENDYGLATNAQELDLDAALNVDFENVFAPDTDFGSLGGALDDTVSSLANDSLNGVTPQHSSTNVAGDRQSSSLGLAESTSALESVTSGAPHSPADGREFYVLKKHPPAWSELRTKAGRERKRLPLACIACRRKKIRCSGEKPACNHCLRSRIPCVYKVTTRKAAPRTDYMAMLDKRLKRMEERVIKIIPKDEQPDAIAATGRANVRPPLPLAPPKPNTKKRAVEQAFSEELDEWANDKAVEPQANRYGLQEPELDGAATKDTEEYSLLREGADRLPSKELQEHLTEVYFDFVYCQSYPLLHKPSFLRKLAQGTVPPVLMLSICAVSARFSNHTAVQGEPAFLRGEAWAAPARDIALRRYDAPNITILICYLMLGLHEFGTCQGGRSWMLAGMAQRMAYALQLHRDLDFDPKARQQDGNKDGLTSTDREIRRRTMWACFLMDRFNSSGTERPVFVGEQYIQAQLPINEDFFQKEIAGPTEDLEGSVPNPVDVSTGQVSDAKANMGVGAYLIRLVAIWGKIVHYLNLGGRERDKHPMWAEESTFSAMKRSTQKWMHDLPQPLHYTPENLQTHASLRIANQFLFMHMVYNQIILFTNRFALPSPGSRPSFPKEMPVEFVQQASRAAFDAANQISALVNEAMQHSVVAPFAGYCAFYSSTVHVNGAFSKNPAIEASSKQNLAWNVKYLTRMKKYWGMFHFVTENLRELYRRHADAARQGGSSTSEDFSGKGIFQYGDWFDRYPHGVSGTHYEEPSTKTMKEPGADAVLGQTSDLQTVEEFFSKLAPPSHLVQQQRQATNRTARKKKRSKSESKPKENGPPDQQSTQDRQHHFAATSERPATFEQHGQGNIDAAVDNKGFNHALLGRGEPPMSQLERQTVLNSYSGFEGSSSATAPHDFMAQPLPQSPQHMFDPYGFETFPAQMMSDGNGVSVGGDGLWGDPSAAWFMPFNMNPPNVGEANGISANMNSHANWTNVDGLGAMGGEFTFAMMPPSPGIDLDTNLENIGRVSNLDGL